MESSTKWALGIGGVVVAAAAGYGIYRATRGSPRGAFGYGTTGPGKFEGGMSALKRLLWTATLESWGEEEVGDENWGDGCVLVSGPLPLDELQKQFPQEYAGIDHEDKRELVKAKGGAIVCTDSQGFVDVDLFPTKKALGKRWRRIERSYERREEG